MSVSGGGSKRLVSKNDILTLIPASDKGLPVQVRMSVEKGAVALKSWGRRKFFRKTKINSKHNLKMVWISDMTDDEVARIKNCFVMITPEVNYILQSDSHRSKIEWMRSLSIAVSQSLKFRGSYRPSNWSNLDDLQKWLLTRDFTYQFHAHKTYKGAVYSGKWTLGMPHIYGSLKWTNGDRYDGEFAQGKFEGSGTFMWFSHPTYRHYTGAWQGGAMEGHGDMLFVDQSTYIGWWHSGMRHGHGRMEYKSEDCTYIGGWECDLKCGYGVHDNKKSQERYLGMWKDDKYHGAGILMANNKFHFSGDFINGKRSYNVSGSKRRRSRCVIQDQKWEALFKAMASLLEQMANTSHKDVAGMEVDTSIKTSINDEDSAVAMDFTENSSPLSPLSPHTEPWGDGGSSSGSITRVSYPGCPALTLRDGELEGSCAVCKIEGFKSINHPFGLLVSHLAKYFVDSYSGVAVHASLLPHAVSEICSTTSRVHDLVRKYSPSLITRDENELLGKPKTHLSMLLKRSPHQRRKVSYQPPDDVDYSWLYPILLPAIFPTLFALYLEHYAQDDFKMDHVISMLGHYDDEDLSGLLEIRSDYEEWKKTGMPCFTFSNYLSGATEIFKSFCGYCTPRNKLLCFQEVQQELDKLWIPSQVSSSFLSRDKSYDSSPLSVMEDEEEEEEEEETEYETSFTTISDATSFEGCISIETLESTASPVSQDGDLECKVQFEEEEEEEESRGPPVGLFTFVVVRSRVRHLYSEMQFIQDFAGSTLLLDDYGFLLSKLKDSYYQLIELNL